MQHKEAYIYLPLPYVWGAAQLINCLLLFTTFLYLWFCLPHMLGIGVYGVVQDQEVDQVLNECGADTARVQQ